MSGTGFKTGNLVTVGRSVLIQRLQSAGPGDIKRNSTKIYQLGSRDAIFTWYDAPTTSYSMESYDVRPTTEELIFGGRKADVAVTVTTTAGNAVVTVDSGPVNGTMIGDGITIAGAGAAGADLVAEIVAVGAGSLTLNKEAVTTVASVATTVRQIRWATNAPKPINVINLARADADSANPDDVEFAAILPYLNYESISWKFSDIKSQGSKTVTLSGADYFTIQGSGFEERIAGTGTAGQVIALAHPAFIYEDDVLNPNRAVLSAHIEGTGQRLLPNTDYVETIGAANGAGAHAVSVTVTAAVPTNDHVVLVYLSSDVAQYPDAINEIVSATAPAAISGQNVEVLLGGESLTDRLAMVQSANIDCKITNTPLQEFGSYSNVAIDSEMPTATGALGVLPRQAKELDAFIRKATGKSDVTKVVGATTTANLPLVVKLYSPDLSEDGKRICLATIYVPDARFTDPGFTGKVNDRLPLTLNWESDKGVVYVYEGEKP